MRLATRPVSLLVTMDLELAPDHDRAEQAGALARLGADLAALGLPLTVFSTSDAARTFAPEVQELSLAGHEIGCHGVGHGPAEDFRRMSLEDTRRVLTEATTSLEELQVPRPRSFRGPSMTTSSTTQRCLVEAGYLTDLSVCPQRFDIFLSRGGSVRWLLAPRRPYSPSASSPYRRGSLPLTVVPLSSIGLPFISGVLYLFGFSVMALLLRMLLEEARWRRTAIVYLFHSYEFAQYRYTNQSSRRFHHTLYIQDRETRYVQNLRLLKHLLAQPHLTPTVATAFAQFLKGESQ
jgi:peptidoglycan/xylan/chitin deacetylase (PgdA/CDA1 family)